MKKKLFFLIDLYLKNIKDAFNIVGFCRVQVEFNLSIQTWVEYKIGPTWEYKNYSYLYFLNSYYYYYL